ncbi:hypothetical protein P5673_005424, partial [Acropora cervicornis]
AVSVHKKRLQKRGKRKKQNLQRTGNKEEYECHHLIQLHFTRLSNGKLTVNLCKSDLGRVQATYLEHACRVKPVDSRIGDMVSFSQP